jgi:hypothetical protein
LSVITGRESDELLDTLVYLKRTGFAVALILIQPGRPRADLHAQASLLGVPIHRIWHDHDLEAWG